MAVKKTNEVIVEEFKAIHGDRFDYSKTDYQGWDTNILYDCPKHGERSQLPASHRKGKGCARCSGRIECHQDFIDDVTEVHGNKYIYLEEYVNANTKLKVQCKKCKTIFRPRPGDHLGGGGCPNCAKSGFNSLIPSILYYLKDTRNNLYKIGVTNFNVSSRFKAKMEYIIILKTWSFDIGEDARELEQFLLSEFKEYRCINKNFRDSRGGHTEFFNKDILRLDKET